MIGEQVKVVVNKFKVSYNFFLEHLKYKIIDLQFLGEKNISFKQVDRKMVKESFFVKFMLYE